jgi:hypothetical protein
MIAAALILTRLQAGTARGYLLGSYLIFGVAMGLVNPPITNTAVSGMPGSQAGVAAAVASTCRQLGMTVGVAVIGAISGGTLAGGIGKGFAVATHPGWWIIVALGGVILVLAVLTTGAWALETARRAVAELPEQSQRGGYQRGTPLPASGKAS